MRKLGEIRCKFEWEEIFTDAYLDMVTQTLYSGRQKALRLLGTSSKVDVHEALSMGLIDGIVSATGINTAPLLHKEVKKSVIDMYSTPHGC